MNPHHCRLCTLAGLLGDLDDLLKVREGPGLELGVHQDVVDLDLKRPGPADLAVDLGVRQPGSQAVGQVPVPGPVASSAAVLDEHLHGHGQREGGIKEQK